MERAMAERVYQTLSGELEPWAQVPGVENLFDEGKNCQIRYEEIYCAYQRICEKIGAGDEDDDLEMIINHMRRIQQEIAFRMYEYGAMMEQKESK